MAGLVQSIEAGALPSRLLPRRYADRADLDPARLAEVERRIEAIHGCARKYRVPLVELPALLAGWRTRLAELGKAPTWPPSKPVPPRLGPPSTWPARLSQGRHRAADELAAAVTDLMRQLALTSGRFSVALVPLPEGAGLRSGAGGIPRFRPGRQRGAALAKVVSGGELSRLSLAIQVVTSRSASVPTLIFDEVDVGIGGGVAEIVGRLLREWGPNGGCCASPTCPRWRPRQLAVAGQQGNPEGATSRIQILDEAGRVGEIAHAGGVEDRRTSPAAPCPGTPRPRLNPGGSAGITAAIVGNHRCCGPSPVISAVSSAAYNAWLFPGRRGAMTEPAGFGLTPKSNLGPGGDHRPQGPRPRTGAPAGGNLASSCHLHLCPQGRTISAMPSAARCHVSDVWAHPETHRRRAAAQVRSPTPWRPRRPVRPGPPGRRPNFARLEQQAQQNGSSGQRRRQGARFGLVEATYRKVARRRKRRRIQRRGLRAGPAGGGEKQPAGSGRHRLRGAGSAALPLPLAPGRQAGVRGSRTTKRCR